MAVGSHDDYVGADIDRVLSQRFIDQSAAARNAIDTDVYAMPGEEDGDIRAGLLAVDRLWGKRIDDRDMHLSGGLQQIDRLPRGARSLLARIPSQQDYF